MMPSLLRSRMAHLALFGSFLIPVAFSSLRGLTHTVSCEEQTETPFTLRSSDNAPATVATSKVFVQGEPVALCGGLVLEMGVFPVGQDSVDVDLNVTNRSDSSWKGSVWLRAGRHRIPVDIGLLRPGATGREQVRVNVSGGASTLEGTLFVGP